jgi:ParB-like chromosome segregation protein Spo0J
LHPDPRNARRHERKQVRQIADSIRAFGFNVPILVDADLKVIAGHGRLLACRQLGQREVPTISLEHLSEAQACAFMIADNRLTDRQMGRSPARRPITRTLRARPRVQPGSDRL